MNEVSREVGTGDARGRGYKPNALKQRLEEVPRGRYRRRRQKGAQAPRTQELQDVKLNERSAWLVLTTLVEGDTGPTHLSSG